MTKLYFILVGLVLLLSKCKDEQPPVSNSNEVTLTLDIQLNNQGVPYVLKNPLTVGSNPRFYYETFMFYMHKPALIKSDNSLLPLADVFLVDADPNIETNFPKRDKNKIGLSFTYKIPKGSYKGIAFGLGSGTEVNGEKIPSQFNPNSFPVGHPYSYGAGMDWDAWNTYRHIRIEGMIDSTKSQSGLYNLPLTWHTGFDSLYRDMTMSKSISAEGDVKLILSVDIDKILNNKLRMIKLPEDKYTEMGGDLKSAELGIKITDNLKDALELK